MQDFIRSHHLDRRAHQIIEQGVDGNPDDLLDTKEMAAWFGNSPQWFEIGRSRGYGPPFIRLGSRSVRYQRKFALRWLESRIHACTSEYQPSQVKRTKKCKSNKIS